MVECPQGCIHPAFGEDTVKQRTERERRQSPVVFEHMGETVVQEYYVRQFLECRVCGWVMDL